MTKAQLERSKRRTRRMKEKLSSGSLAKPARRQTQRSPKVAADKPRARSRSNTPISAAKEKRSKHIGKTAGQSRVSVSSRAKPRAVAASSSPSTRRKYAASKPQPADDAIAFEAEAIVKPEHVLQAILGQEAASELAPAIGVGQQHAVLPPVSQRGSAPHPSAFISAMRANVAMHRVMTVKAIATLRFASALARCRSPIDIWRAQLQFTREMLQPAA